MSAATALVKESGPNPRSPRGSRLDSPPRESRKETLMPLTSYGVLVARALDRRREGTNDDTPHYQLHLKDERGTEFRAAINVKSQQEPSELLHWVCDDFQHPVTAPLAALSSGWNPLPSRPGEVSLDFVRGNL